MTAKTQYFCKDCDFIGAINLPVSYGCPKCKGELVELCHLHFK